MNPAQIDLLLSRIDRAKQIAPNRWKAPCTAHPDRSPSLYITELDSGVILLKCFAGCSTQAIVESVGLSLTDLFPSKTARDYDPTKPRSKVSKFSKSELFDPLLIEAVILALSFDAIRSHDAVSESDQQRADKAFNVVMRLHSEVYS